MTDRRLVGIDLGIASAHTVRVLDGEGQTLAKRKCWPTAQSLAEVEQAALAGTRRGTRLEVVIEPTGPAWLPIAVFFTNRGHVVHRVSSAKAADLRRFLSRHAKSNGIDADTLARLPLVDRAGLRPLELPDADRAGLDRRVRACDRLTSQAALHKRRIKDLVRQLMPMSPLEGDLGRADLAVLEQASDPNVLLRMSLAALTALITAASHGQQGEARARRWLAAAEAAVELYGASEAVAFSELAGEVGTEVRLLGAVEAELERHAPERERRYQAVDPQSLARSLPGIAKVGAPPSSPAWAEPRALRAVPDSAPSPGSPRRRRRRARPTERASPCPKPAAACCAPPWCGRPTTPDARTPS